MRLILPVSRSSCLLCGCSTLQGCANTFSVIDILTNSYNIPLWGSQARKIHTPDGRLGTTQQADAAFPPWPREESLVVGVRTSQGDTQTAKNSHSLSLVPLSVMEPSR